MCTDYGDFFQVSDKVLCLNLTSDKILLGMIPGKTNVAHDNGFGKKKTSFYKE